MTAPRHHHSRQPRWTLPATPGRLGVASRVRPTFVAGSARPPTPQPARRPIAGAATRAAACHHRAARPPPSRSRSSLRPPPPAARRAPVSAPACCHPWRGRGSGRTPRVRSHCRFRNRSPEYVSESGITWISGRTKRQCDRALRTPAWCPRRPPSCSPSRAATARPPASPGRHCHSTLPLTVIGCHSLGG